jgi:hypothetical protein
MYNSNNKYCTLEILLNELYRLFEVNSSVFIDELGYKWYELLNVLDILKIDEEEYINGYYLMLIEDVTYISEEGINMLLLEYDNDFRDEILNYLTEDVMPDIKSDLMYLGYEILDGVRNLSLATMLNDKRADSDFKIAAKMEGYATKKVRRTMKREENRENTKKVQQKRRH